MSDWLMRLAALRASARSFAVLSGLHALVLSAMLTACGGGGGGASPPPQLSISAQPVDVQVTEGQTANFAVGVAGAATYQWERADASGWTSIPGANDATYTFVAASADSGARFRAVVTSRANAANTITSSAATLTVEATVKPIVIELQPWFGSTAAYVGEQRTLSITVSGTSPAWQWQRSDDHGTTWTDIAGAVSASWTLDATLDDNGAEVRVVVSNALGPLASSGTTLVVQPAPAYPLFTTPPTDSTVPVGQAATFNAVAVGDPAPTLKWQTAFNVNGPWADIAGATGGTYTAPAAVPADDGRLVRAVATNAKGSAVAVATLHVNASSVAPGISEQPADVGAAPGSSATFDAHGYGAPSVTYQWQISTDGGATFTNVNGATSHAFTITRAAASDDGKRLRVVVSNSLGSVTSRAALLTVMEAPALDGIGPGERWRPGVTGAYFVARATGGQLHYQWQIGVATDGSPADVPGATARDFALPATTPANIDQVCVTVTNPAGSLQRCAPLMAITWRSPQTRPMNGGVFAIAKVDASTAVAGGGNGELMRSTDAGATWSVVSEASWSQDAVTSIALNGPIGIAVAGYDTRFTSDGGMHWSTGPRDYSFLAEAAAYTPDGTLVKVGSGGVRLSGDNGLTWRDATTDAESRQLWRVAFNGAGVGIAVGAGTRESSAGSTGAISRSVDGGATWTAVLLADSPVSAVAFVSDSVAVAVDWSGNLWRSTDAGLTWTVQATGRNAPVFSVAFASANVGAAWCGDGTALRTTDGGVTWTVAGTTTDMETITPLSASVLLAGNAGGTMLRSTDGGASWTEEGTSHGPMLISTAFADASTGVVVGTGGAIERTTDAGATWNTVPSGVATELAEVRFGDARHGLAVGEAGVILATSDAGASWQPVASPTQGRWMLWSVAYAGPDLVFTGGQTGVWKSIDGGASWQSAGDFGSFPEVYCVRFGDSQHGLAAAQNRQLWRTTDGGQTWSVVTTNFDQYNDPFNGIADMRYLTPTTVVGVTPNGSIVRSTNAGATWQVTRTGMSFISKVFFRDTQVGIAIGDGILRTTDGGLTWTLDNGALAMPSLREGAALGAHSMIVVGAYNLIYRSDDF